MSGMNFKKTLLALLLTLALLFTLTLPAFATDVDATADDPSSDVSGTVEEPTDSANDPTGSDSEPSESTGASADGTTGKTETTGATGTTATTTAATTTAADEGFSVGDWISLGIGAVILLVILVLAILFITAKDDPDAGKNGDKVPFALRGKRFFRSCKSEGKKVVWTPWKTVRKNTLVVIIVIVICAIVIGLLDWVFSRGINALAGLF